MIIRKFLFVPILFIAITLGNTANALLIDNDDFETGDFTGWTLFTFDSGSSFGGTGSTSVTSFDTNNDSISTYSAQFQVGQVAGPIGGGSPRIGGGIYQTFFSEAGILDISIDIAMEPFSNNADGGLFELLLDDDVLDSFDFGNTTFGIVEYGLLQASKSITTGLHEIKIRMGRGYGNSSSTPRQYVDNVSLQFTPDASIPEPMNLFIFGIGLAFLIILREKKGEFSGAE